MIRRRLVARPQRLDHAPFEGGNRVNWDKDYRIEPGWNRLPKPRREWHPFVVFARETNAIVCRCKKRLSSPYWLTIPAIESTYRYFMLVVSDNKVQIKCQHCGPIGSL